MLIAFTSPGDGSGASSAAAGRGAQRPAPTSRAARVLACFGMEVALGGVSGRRECGRGRTFRQQGNCRSQPRPVQEGRRNGITGAESPPVATGGPGAGGERWTSTCV